MTLRAKIVIRTPEGIEFDMPLAGPISRMLALAIDLSVVFAAVYLVQSALSFLRFASDDLFQALVLVLYFLISLCYSIFTEWLWRGQTVGKRLMRIRVMAASGLRLKPAQVVIRNVLRFVDMLPGFYLVGGACCLLSQHRQRLGDLAAGTVVIRTPEIQPLDVAQLLNGKFNSLAESRQLAARLRQKTRPEVAQLALDALLRRDSLDPEARLQLFREFAAYFQSLATFPPEITEQLSDEQYVRNTVDVLFRASARGPSPFSAAK